MSLVAARAAPRGLWLVLLFGGVATVGVLRWWLRGKPALAGSGGEPKQCSTPPVKIEGHQKKEVSHVQAELVKVRPAVQQTLALKITAVRVAHDADKPTAPGTKLVHFIRHGEGAHNVAQREWRGAGKAGEPYTLDTDPHFGYQDAELTATGVQQATALQVCTAALQPELLVVSPMRRATKTGLLAFEANVQGKRLPVVAHELAHETGGKHTCDKRLPVTQLSKLYPAVDYSLLESEEDPFWGQGLTRESWGEVAKRGGKFIEWLAERPEKHIAVAAHSGFLFGLLTAVLDVDNDEDKSWFGTGEMRTMVLTFEPREGFPSS